MDSESPAMAKSRPTRITNRIDSNLFTPMPREEVFGFFAQPENLSILTPDWLKFRIVTPPPIEMKPGAVIDYRISMRGIPMTWRTVITVWEPPFRFVDEQAKGPYRYWRHEHTFKERDGGTILGDHVEYATPFGWLSDLLFVRRNIRTIFKHREKVMRERFDATELVAGTVG
jgi:ligand-binding SRPBCC domain-containing protein